MAYDKKLLSEARRQLERDRAARLARLDDRRHMVYEACPRIRTIEKELSHTAASVLKAALESGGDPSEAIDRLREHNLSLQAERSALLNQLQFPSDYLSDKPDCPLCGDSGYDGNAVCTCVRNRYAKLLQKQLSSILPLSSQNFSTFRLELYDDRPDQRLGISPRQNMEYNLQVCRSYADKFGSDPSHLLLYGSTGLGKTFLACCVVDVVSKNGFSVVYDTAARITEMYRNQKFGTGEDTSNRTASYEQTDLLVIDDLGIETTAPLAFSSLYSLINHRLLTRKPMIIITTQLPNRLEEKYGPALASRLLGDFLSLRFFGENIRQRKTRRQITPAASKATNFS